MIPIKIEMMNVIGKFIRMPSSGSIFYRKKDIEDDLDIYQQENNFVSGTWNSVQL